ncbi:ABC-type transport system involved in multi-copper enzyme maturation, permease component [Halorhabdus sp. SVX81]|uniref:ABC transporter permease subunit n=1 Tax=Halorhabdus sp. SVX81 TaxID=2978283 RepID=UPI0023DBF94A|nr:ABC transporter permease subunit [Halorhabdus sp. SVX81]WEL18634.1 ABC-type transport system involved in multi-copper enzyme maturation, permease component [Halorhabdus sp. SVX81]
MFETTRFESERLFPASAVIGLGLAAFGGMMTLIAPGILGEVDMAALLEQFPSAMVEEMGLGKMGTIEGFIALELYEYVWLLGLGVYVAYTAAGSIAGDVETGRMDTLLAAPISRWRLLVEKYLALLTPIVVVNVVVFAGVAGAIQLIDETIPIADLAAVHILSVPYLLACGAFGMLASVAAPRRRLAEGVAAGAVIGTFLFEMLVTNTDIEWLGGITPMRYYDPLAILSEGTYDPAGGAVLSGVTVVLVAGSAWLFAEVDVE